MKNHSVLSNIVFETFIGGLSRIVGIIGLLYAAWTFGATRDTDLVYYSTTLIFSILGFFTTINGNIILPQFLLKLEKKGEAAAWDMVCTFLTIASTLIGVLSILVYILFKNHIGTISKFEGIGEENIKILALIVSVTLFASYLADFLSTLFRGYRNYLIPNVAIILSSLIGLLSLILTTNILGAISIAFSFLVMQITQLIFLFGFFIQKKRIIEFHMRGIYDLTNTFKLIPPYLIGQVAAAIVVLFPNYLLTGFDGGALTAITYARRIFELVPALIVMPIISALTPNFNDIIRGEKKSEITKMLSDVSSVLYSILIPISIFILINSNEVVSISLGWKNYSLIEQNLTAEAMNWYFLALFVLGSNAVITKALAMTQNVRLAYTMLVFAVAPAVGVPLFTAVGMDIFGVTGVATGYAIYMLSIHFFIGYYFVGKIFNKFSLRNEAASMLRPFFYSLLAGGVASVVGDFFFIVPPLNLIIFACLYLCCYVSLHIINDTYEFNLFKNKIMRIKNAS